MICTFLYYLVNGLFFFFKKRAAPGWLFPLYQHRKLCGFQGLSQVPQKQPFSTNQMLKFFWYLQLTTDVQDEGQVGPVGVTCHGSWLPTSSHTNFQPQLCPLIGKHWEMWPCLVSVSGYPQFTEGCSHSVMMFQQTSKSSRQKKRKDPDGSL